MVPRKQAGHMTCTRPQAERQILLAMRASSTHDPELSFRTRLVRSFMWKRSIGRIACNGRVDEDAVLLRLGLRLVILVDVLDRALSQERARQDQHADEAARPVGRCLGEYRGRAGLIPGAPRAIRGRAAVG